MKDNLLVFKRIRTKSKSDLILQQMRELILTGVLKPGDRLPSEILLAKQLDVSRGELREALNKLEYHGVLRTLPQSGTFLEKIGILALTGIFDSILNLAKNDFLSLLKAREFLEEKTSELAATSCSKKEIKELELIHVKFIDTHKKIEAGSDLDLYFHLKVAEFSRNTFLSYFLCLIVPEIFKLNRQVGSINEKRFELTLKEHENILTAIKNSDPIAATSAMKKHLQRTHENRLIEIGCLQKNAKQS